MAQAPYFYNCIAIDDFRYKTVAKSWRPQIIRPSSARVNLQGNLETTYAGFAIARWEGIVIAPVIAPARGTASYPWGDIETLRASLAGSANIAFIDHYGKKYDPSTIIAGSSEESIQNIWNGAQNHVLVQVQIMSTVAKGLQMGPTYYP